MHPTHHAGSLHRITSYNVCYTKLLRFLLPFAEVEFLFLDALRGAVLLGFRRLVVGRCGVSCAGNDGGLAGADGAAVACRTGRRRIGNDRLAAAVLPLVRLSLCCRKRDDRGDYQKGKLV